MTELQVKLYCVHQQGTWQYQQHRSVSQPWPAVSVVVEPIPFGLVSSHFPSLLEVDNPRGLGLGWNWLNMK